MTNREIKRLAGKTAIKRGLSASLIPVAAIPAALFFMLLPGLLPAAAELLGLKPLIQEVQKYLYPGLITAVMALISLHAFFTYSSASIGEKAFFLGIMNGRSNCAARFFFWFKLREAVRAARLTLLTACLKLLYLAVFLLPAAAVFSAVFILAQSGGIEVYLFAALTAGGVLLTLNGLVFWFIGIQKFFLAPYLTAEEPGLPAVTAVKRSKNLLEGHVGRLIGFKLSFIPWFLLCLLALPAFFVYPYYKQSCCVIAKELRL
ncbi:MAG: DUF975 family protein [Clostridia bacterium]|nr:DUF975 family protein [Clostridia bacterium]